MQKTLALSLAITLTLVMAQGIARAQQVKLSGATAEVYKKASGSELYIYRFDPDGHDPKKDARPAVVFFFGGGWKTGKVAQLVPHSRYLASRGMVTFVADYRVNSRQKVAPNACVEDGKSAVRWIRKNAKRLGIAPDKIIAGGGSAGGHVAAATGICEGFDNQQEDLSISSKSNALILFNPVYDNGQDGGYGHDRIKEWFPAISPAHNITPDDPPAIVFFGTNDKHVPVATAESFRDKMNQQRIQTELHLYEGKTHGFFNKGRDGFSDTLAKTDQFLVKLGYLSGPADLEMIKSLNGNHSKQRKATPSPQEKDSQTTPNSQTTKGQLSAASTFTDNAVLQRDLPLPVWGTAESGATVTVEFAQQKKSSVADRNGQWKVELDPMKANANPQTLRISGPKSNLTFSNVLVGEVWICSGQSNMKMERQSIPEINALVGSAKNIRYYPVPRTVAFTEQDRCEGKWTEKPPISAVAFAFAYHLEQSADVPVGIIEASWGSSSIEGWMPRDMTQKLPHFKKQMRAFDANAEKQNRIKGILEGPKPWNLKSDIFLRTQPNVIYNAMMHPLAPYGCRGVVWYQGEANAKSVPTMLQYDDTLKAWMQRYRQQWDRDDLHFLAVMLPGYYKPIKSGNEKGPQNPSAHSWAWMRESQMKTLELEHTAVVNTIDLGLEKNIHPKDKLPIGQRLALLAARDTLGQSVEAEGPAMNRVETRGAKLVVHFDHANGLKTLNGKPPTEFWVADNSQKWIKANAVIQGQTVELSSPAIKKPRYVRYAFVGKPNVNLVNADGLPAYPFRTDTFKP